MYHPASRRLDTGGADLTQYLARLVGMGVGQDSTVSDDEWVSLEALKEGCIRVADAKNAAADVPSEVGPVVHNVRQDVCFRTRLHFQA